MMTRESLQIINDTTKVFVRTTEGRAGFKALTETVTIERAGAVTIKLTFGETSEIVTGVLDWNDNARIQSIASINFSALRAKEYERKTRRHA